MTCLRFETLPFGTLTPIFLHPEKHNPGYAARLIFTCLYKCASLKAAVMRCDSSMKPSPVHPCLHGSMVIAHQLRHLHIITDTCTSAQTPVHHHRHLYIITDIWTSSQTLGYHHRHLDIITNTWTLSQTLGHHHRHLNVITDTWTSSQTLGHNHRH